MSKYEFKKMNELPVIEELPDVLDGVRTAAEWAERRVYIKELLAHYLLGHRPENDIVATGEVLASSPVYGGKGIRDEVRIHIGNGEHFDAYVVRPNREGKFPAITWVHFKGFGECPIGEELVDRGYVLAAYENNLLCKDDKDDPVSPAKRAYPEADWAAIMIWGWGLSKLADYLVTLDYVDPYKLICTGHSRNGKAALSAGAYDERFAVVAPINSGAGGAGCCRFLGDTSKVIQDPAVVESLGRITSVFPHWFSENVNEFGMQEAPHSVCNENRLPFDLHFFKALVCPRGLITIEGTEDLWANCYGTHLTRLSAQPAFNVCGVPGRNQQIIRNGPHMHGPRDWRWTLDFAENVFKGYI